MCPLIFFNYKWNFSYQEGIGSIFFNVVFQHVFSLLILFYCVGLTELKIQEIPLLNSYTAHERRFMVISRLPNIQILNGGDKIKPGEREDSERAFIRYYLYSESVEEGDRSARVDELIEVHGLLEPLANVDLSPEISVSVTIKYKVRLWCCILFKRL